MVVFGDGGLSSVKGDVRGYIRPTDGSPAVLLGTGGNPTAFSPDGKWIVTSSATARSLSLLPTGVGESRPLDTGRVTGFTLMNGGRDGCLTVTTSPSSEAKQTGRSVCSSRVLTGESLRAVTPEGVFGPFVVSPDSRVIVVRDQTRQLYKYPVAGGAPTIVAGALPGDEPLSWSSGRRVHLGAQSHDYAREDRSPRPAGRTPRLLA